MWIEDFRNAFRGLRSARGFALTAILSLTVGIGGSVSMFTVVNSILLKPLSYPDSGRLVCVTNAHTGAYASSRAYGDSPGLLALQFIRWRKQVQSLDSIALTTFGNTTATLTGTGRPELWVSKIQNLSEWWRPPGYRDGNRCRNDHLGLGKCSRTGAVLESGRTPR